MDGRASSKPQALGFDRRETNHKVSRIEVIMNGLE